MAYLHLTKGAFKELYQVYQLEGLCFAFTDNGKRRHILKTEGRTLCGLRDPLYHIDRCQAGYPYIHKVCVSCLRKLK